MNYFNLTDQLLETVYNSHSCLLIWRKMTHVDLTMWLSGKVCWCDPILTLNVPNSLLKYFPVQVMFSYKCCRNVCTQDLIMVLNNHSQQFRNRLMYVNFSNFPINIGVLTTMVSNHLSVIFILNSSISLEIHRPILGLLSSHAKNRRHLSWL